MFIVDFGIEYFVKKNTQFRHLSLHITAMDYPVHLRVEIVCKT